jgi:hypothetical protein
MSTVWYGLHMLGILLLTPEYKRECTPVNSSCLLMWHLHMLRIMEKSAVGMKHVSFFFKVFV